MGLSLRVVEVKVNKLTFIVLIILALSIRLINVDKSFCGDETVTMYFVAHPDRIGDESVYPPGTPTMLRYWIKFGEWINKKSLAYMRTIKREE